MPPGRAVRGWQPGEPRSGAVWWGRTAAPATRPLAAAASAPRPRAHAGSALWRARYTARAARPPPADPGRAGLRGRRGRGTRPRTPGGLPLPGCLEGERRRLRAHGALPGALPGSRALRAARAALAVVAREAHLEDRAAVAIMGDRSRGARPSAGTGRSPRFPVQREAGEREARPRAGLPGAIRQNRPADADSRGRFAAHYRLRRHLARIPPLLPGEALLRGQGRVAPREHFDVHRGPGRALDMRQAVRGGGLTRFGPMRFVAAPVHGSFGAVAG